MYWIDDRKEEKALLLCGFGTGDAEEMERTYGRLLEEARKENPAMAVRLALTSAKVIERLFLKNVLRLPDVRSALEEIAAGGAGEVRILPVQVVGGREYEKLKELADQYSSRMKISLESPLLGGPKIGRVAEILVKEAAPLEEEAVVYIGHGTHGRDPAGPAAYRKLEEMIRSMGNDNIFIGDLQTGAKPLRKALSAGAFRRIRLCSLMLVSGHHWSVDVVGEQEDSWKSTLIKEGYIIDCIGNGLLERKGIRDLVLDTV